MSITKMKQLRSQGMTYQQIADELGCVKSTVSYHLSPGQKQKSYKRGLKRHPVSRKIEHFFSRKQYKQKPKTNRSITRLLQDKTKDFSRGVPMNRAKYIPATFTVDDVFQKFGENPKCYLTGEEIDLNRPRTYQFDHIIPKSRGGSSNIDNLGICTKQANLSKTNMTLDEYLEHCKNVLRHHGHTISKS